ncbi:MAG: hypothetical protein K2G96_05080 [Clostridia bacterium]|nr:hypothetical protein [Clostridia bacterium]
MNSSRIKECTELSTEILKNFELSEIPISNIILKCLRLCRLLGDEEGILLFTYESSGYPSEPSGLPRDSWRISEIAGRRYFDLETDKDGTSKKVEYAKTNSIAEMEETIAAQKLRLSSTIDPDISISSANPHQFVNVPHGNTLERSTAVSTIKEAQKWIQKISGCLYNYVLKIYYKLSYGNIVEDTFTKSRLEVNDKLSVLCPKAIEKFITVYNNMDSNDPEDWANAVHSCRRILVDLADVLYPAKDEPLFVNGKKISVGKDQYINRLIQFIESKSDSETYAGIVGADLESIGKRIDAISNAACKGTHSEVTKEEASRYIIHTYLLISDIVSLYGI